MGITEVLKIMKQTMKALWSKRENGAKKVRCNERMDFFFFFEHLKRNKRMILCDLFLLIIEISLWQKIREAHHDRIVFGQAGFIMLRSTSCCGNQVKKNIYADSLYVFLCV